jgi:hypothetical protein
VAQANMAPGGECNTDGRRNDPPDGAILHALLITTAALPAADPEMVQFSRPES